MNINLTSSHFFLICDQTSWHLFLASPTEHPRELFSAGGQIKQKHRLSASETGTKTKPNASAHNNFMCRCDQSGTLGDERCGSLAELCDWWNIHSCCWSNVKQQTGSLHLNIFLSPRPQNVTKWLSDKMQLISALKNIACWCNKHNNKETVSLKMESGSLPGQRSIHPPTLTMHLRQSLLAWVSVQKRDSRKTSEWLASFIWSNQNESFGCSLEQQFQ